MLPAFTIGASVVLCCLLVFQDPAVSGQVHDGSRDLRDRIDALETKDKLQAIQIERLETLVHSLQTNVQELTNHNKDVHQAANLKDVFVKKTRDRSEGTSYEGSVAFQAWMANFTTYSAGDNHSVVFDHEVTNVGGGYDVSSGMFVAPSSGLYVITAALEVQYAGPDYIYGDIMKNGKIFNSMFHFAEGFQAQSSVTLVVQLAAGNELGIVIGSAFNDVKLREKGASSFSGFLLTPG